LGEKTNFRVDLDDERLLEGAKPVAISNKAFQLLRLFVENPNRLLTKEHILDVIWGDLYVTEGLIKEYVHELRGALHDDARRPKFIETVHGRGYRFLGGINAASSQTVSVQDNGRDRPSVAVLPFENMSGDPDEDYFSDGLSEELITSLSFVPWLFVIARNSSHTFRGKSADLREVGEVLGVRYIVTGSVRRWGDRLRVNSQLIETEHATQIWAQRFESKMTDVFDLQDEITQGVVGAIGPKIQLAEIMRASRKHPEDLTAYDMFLRARSALNRMEISEAAQLLDQAIEHAPDYAKAKAFRGWCTTLVGWRFVTPDAKQRELAIRFAQEALMRPACDAETQAYAGYTIAFYGRQIDRGISLVEEVTRDCPSFAWAHASLALLESYHGDARKAILCANSALTLNPRDPQSFRCEMAICKAYLRLSEFEKSLAYAERGLIKSPRNTYFQMCRIACMVHLGRQSDAVALGERFRRQNPDFTISKWRALADNWRAWTVAAQMMESALLTAKIPE
jgi:adenylate cyclase